MVQNRTSDASENAFKKRLKKSDVPFTKTHKNDTMVKYLSNGV